MDERTSGQKRFNTSAAGRGVADVAPAHIPVKGVAVDFLHGNRNQRVIQDIDLAVSKGSFVSLIGPSGCGKSTLLKVLAGLVKPSEGDVSVSGMSPLNAVKARVIGLVFKIRLCSLEERGRDPRFC